MKIENKMNSKTFILGGEQEWEPAGDGVVSQIVGYDNDIMMVKVKFQKGSEGTVHRHLHTQLTYVESGEFEFTIDGIQKIVRAGDSLYMKSNVEHSCKCLEAGMLVDCFSPMREDFLKK